MKKFLKIFLIIIITFLVIWIGSLLKCEYLTQKYYDDFQYAYKANTMLGDMEYFKVLSCDGKYAEVYYVSKDFFFAHVLYFSNIDGKWFETATYNTIWASQGNASEVIWPYWWHYIYGGF